MPSKAVSDAFDARLAMWGSKAACPYVDLNVVAEAPASPPYLEIEWPVATETRMGPGTTQVYREEGGARFVLTVAAFDPGWKAQVLTWVEELRDLFRGQFLDGVETFEASPAVFDERNRDGTKYHIPFVVTYRHDKLKSAG